MKTEPIKLVLFAPEFFTIPPKKLRVEECPVANRTYFISDGKIVAVGHQEQAR